MEESNFENIELVEKAKNGSQEAFAKLIEKEKFKLYKTGISILKNDDDTCDAIQETLISVYKKIDTLKENNYFSTWIMRILINKCYDIIRKNKKVTYLNEKMKKEDTYYEMYSRRVRIRNCIK